MNGSSVSMLEPTRVGPRRERRRERFIALLLLAASSALGGAALAGRTLSDAQQVIAALRFPPNTLRVIGGIEGNGRAYRADEPIVLSAEVNRPAAVAVLRVMRTGDTTEVFPSLSHPDARAAAGTKLRIAVPTVASVTAGDTKGAVLFEFIAAADGSSWLFHPQPAAGADFAQFGPTTRALARDIRGALRRAAGRGAATADVTVQIKP
jgi:hypothetical protein